MEEEPLVRVILKVTSCAFFFFWVHTGEEGNCHDRFAQGDFLVSFLFFLSFFS